MGDADREDLSALRLRDYGEEGIPMILGVETVGAPPPRPGEPGLAEAFARLAESLAPDRPGPAAVLELLAHRDVFRRS